MEEEQYSELKQKYQLPEYQEMDQNFDISLIDEEAKKPLKEIQRKIMDKIDHALKLLEDVLHPETTLQAINETTVFTEEERNRLMPTYKKLMAMYREGQALELEANNEQTANFITKAKNTYTQEKTILIKMLRKLQESWTEGEGIKQELGYFG